MSEKISCDRCGEKFPEEQLEVVKAKPDEIGYNANGFEVRGAGDLVVCPACAKQNDGE